MGAEVTISPEGRETVAVAYLAKGVAEDQTLRRACRRRRAYSLSVLLRALRPVSPRLLGAG
ncbi:UNVERIFIED_CONTAM: hypothetical protein NY603_19490, partial [Bacteroidetes bacterium 56_B9]